MLLGLFIFVRFLFFFRLPYLLLSLIMLEVLSFFVIFILASVVSSGFVIVILFSVFVFLAVTGIVGFYTLLVTSGSDFVSSAVSVDFALYRARL